MPLDSVDFPLWIREKLSGAPVMPMLAPDDPGEPPRRPHNKPVPDSLTPSGATELAAMLTKYWAARNYDPEITIEVIPGFTKLRQICSNIVDGVPRKKL